MSPVEAVMYSTNWCGYCQRARNLFERKGVAVREIKLDDEPEQRPVMLQRSGGQRTVPQIFVGELHVGGGTQRVVHRGERDPQSHERGRFEDRTIIEPD